MYCGCNSPVYLCFRQLQQLGRDYRMVVTVHLQIENEAAKCRLKSEAKKKHHRANCQSSLNCSGQSHQESPQNLFLSDDTSEEYACTLEAYLYCGVLMQTSLVEMNYLFLLTIYSDLFVMHFSWIYNTLYKSVLVKM